MAPRKRIQTGSGPGQRQGKRAPQAERQGSERPLTEAGEVAESDASEVQVSGEGEEAEPQGPSEGEIEDVEPITDDALPVLLAREKAPRIPGLVRHDPLTAYMQEIRRYPLLSREDEHELAVKYFETGDMDIARSLVTANLRLVVKIAHEYRRAYKNLLDLVQEGNIGLMQAVKKYDPYRGVKLSSYAAWWIRAYILKFILNNWRLVKIGTTQAQRKLFFNLRKEKENLVRLGFAPEHRLLAEKLDVTEAEVAEMEKRLDGSDLSLDAPASHDEDDSRTRMDLLSGGPIQRPDVQAENQEFRRLLRQKLEEFASALEGREAVLFRERWLSDEQKTLQDIGDQFGISRERARQIEKRLLGRLRTFLEKELGSAVDIGATAEE